MVDVGKDFDTILWDLVKRALALQVVRLLFGGILIAPLTWTPTHMNPAGWKSASRASGTPPFLLTNCMETPEVSTIPVFFWGCHSVSRLRAMLRCGQTRGTRSLLIQAGRSHRRRQPTRT